MRSGSSVLYYVASTVIEKMDLKRGQDTQPASGRAGIFELGLGMFTLPMRLLCPSNLYATVYAELLLSIESLNFWLWWLEIDTFMICL